MSKSARHIEVERFLGKDLYRYRRIIWVLSILFLLGSAIPGNSQDWSPIKQSYSASQFDSGRIGLTGSFVIIIIARDGIIVASDSRGTLYHSTGGRKTPLAYFDGIQKIFPVDGNAIAGTGEGMIGSEFYSEIVNRFRASSSALPVNELLPAFFGYCLWQFPAARKAIRLQQLFAVGYLGETPTICFFNAGQPGGDFGCLYNSGLIQSAPTLISDYSIEELALLPSEKLAQLTTKAIKAYASQNDNWKTIGGDISVLLVSKSGSRWIQNEPAPPRWSRLGELVEVYERNRAIFELIPPTTSQQLDYLLLGKDAEIAKVEPADITPPAPPTNVRVSASNERRRP